MKKSEEERCKLLASGLNTLAVNITVVGSVTPMAALLYGVTAAPAREHLIPVVMIWPLTGLFLHIVARFILKELD